MLGPMANDPYTEVSQRSSHLWSTDATLCPKVEYPDIYNYLISMPSSYTKDKLKAYKSMEGYTYFVDGWVSKVLVHHIPPCSGEEKQVNVVSAGVKHSQRVSSTPLKVWVVAEMLGTICVPIAHAWQDLGKLANTL